jgi:hypothetical protein
MTGAKGTRRRWTDHEASDLVRLRDVDGWPWHKIDRRFNRVKGASQAKYAELKAGVVRNQPGMREPKPPKPKSEHARLLPPWSTDDMARAAEMWRDLFVAVHGEDPSRSVRYPVFEIIGRAVGRTASAIESRMRTHGPSFAVTPSRGPIEREAAAVMQAMIEREARKRAEARRSITARVFGDPPPGYSALDQRMQQCSGSSSGCPSLASSTHGLSQ